MTSPVRTWRMLAAITAGTLALAACGGGDDDVAADPSTAPSASASAGGSAAPANEADGVLTVGTLLPQTGSLAFLGPPEFAGVDLAVQEINANGGVLGKPVAKVDSDSGDTSTNIASQSTQRLLSQGVDAIVGAASSGVSKTVIDAITGAGVVQISPANTSPDFTDYPDKGLYFRTAPSDVLQGRILGDQIIADGNASVGILALQDAYGTGLSENVTKSVEGANGEVVETVIYDPKAAEFTAEVSKIKAADPQAVVLIGFDESAKIIQELAKQGIGPQQGKPLYLVDGNTGNALGEKLPAGVLKGVQGTIPGVAAPGNLRERLLKVDPALKDFSYSAESYDAVVVVALAAEVAKSDAGKDIAAKLVEVTTGGEKCTTIKACFDLAKAGTDFDYDGVSGPIEFDENGDPTEASVGVYTYGADNKLLAKVTYKAGKL
ncbi:MAG: amino acid transporter substrate-binding protein [Frankiales bacterium]|jgi:ABC-type branched-subunit amino acid transport system substrate-binding protein|nr:amino acid transporter substrate-binding protein [Frankiales bacterium]